MTAYILQRLIQSVLVLLAVSVVVFFAVYGIGDPIELLVSPSSSAAEREALAAALPASAGISISAEASNPSPITAV